VAELTRAKVFQPRYGRRMIETRALTCLERCRRKLALDQVPVPIPVEDWIEGRSVSVSALRICRTLAKMCSARLVLERWKAQNRN